MEEEKISNTEETIILEDNSVDIIRQEYEKKLEDMKSKYETRISELNANHIEQIKTIMRTGTSPEAQKVVEEEKPMDEQILESLRGKYKIK